MSIRLVSQFHIAFVLPHGLLDALPAEHRKPCDIGYFKSSIVPLSFLPYVKVTVVQIYFLWVVANHVQNIQIRAVLLQVFCGHLIFGNIYQIGPVYILTSVDTKCIFDTGRKIVVGVNIHTIKNHQCIIKPVALNVSDVSALLIYQAPAVRVLN